jgi:hypothetical protein
MLLFAIGTALPMCKWIAASPVPISASAPCPYCGGIAFQVVRTEPQ